MATLLLIKESRWNKILRDIKISEIENKIVLIENVDPGYDFIFTYGIKIISKYGGANSHMAIRCLELGIPQ